MADPVFDPNAPFTEEVPVFDPNAPFTEEDAAAPTGDPVFDPSAPSVDTAELPETNAFDAAVRGLAKGMTFDQADRFAGFMRALFEDPEGIEGFLDQVDFLTQEERAITAQAEAENPFVAIPGEVAGFIAGPGKFIKLGKGLATGAAELSARAGLVGGVSSLVQGENVKTGVILGALIPPAVRGVGQVMKAVGGFGSALVGRVAKGVETLTGLPPTASKIAADVGVGALGVPPPSLTAKAVEVAGKGIEKVAGTTTAAQVGSLAAPKVSRFIAE